MKKLFPANKCLAVALALGASAAAGSAPALAKSSGLAATDYYNMAPSSLGPVDRFGGGHSVKGLSVRLAQ